MPNKTHAFEHAVYTGWLIWLELRVILSVTHGRTIASCTVAVEDPSCRVIYTGCPGWKLSDFARWLGPRANDRWSRGKLTTARSVSFIQISQLEKSRLRLHCCLSAERVYPPHVTKHGESLARETATTCASFNTTRFSPQIQLTFAKQIRCALTFY